MRCDLEIVFSWQTLASFHSKFLLMEKSVEKEVVEMMLGSL